MEQQVARSHAFRKSKKAELVEAQMKSMDGKSMIHSLQQTKSQSSLLDQNRSYRIKTNNDIVCVGIEDR